MWSALQSLHRVIDTARCCNYFPGGLTHTWISYYEAKVASSQDEVNEWHAMPDVEVCRADKLLFTGESPEDADEDVKKKRIRAKLKVWAWPDSLCACARLSPTPTYSHAHIQSHTRKHTQTNLRAIAHAPTHTRKHTLKQAEK